MSLFHAHEGKGRVARPEGLLGVRTLLNSAAISSRWARDPGRNELRTYFCEPVLGCASCSSSPFWRWTGVFSRSAIGHYDSQLGQNCGETVRFGLKSWIFSCRVKDLGRADRAGDVT